MSLLPLFQWCENAGLIVAMRSSLWLFPVIESIHLMGLALTGGAVLLVDLRLLGFGLRRQPVAQLARDAERWLLVSLAVMIPTGAAVHVVRRQVLLPSGLLGEDDVPAAGARFYLWGPPQGGIGLRDPPGVRAKVVAVVSLALWSSVAIAGRYVGFP